MSHFTKVKTNLVCETSLLQGLQKHSLVTEGKAAIKLNETVRGYQGNNVKADIVLKMKNHDYDIGFRREKEMDETGQVAFEMEADFDMFDRYEHNRSKKIKMSDFMNEVKRRYAYEKVVAQAQSSGYVMAGEPVEQANGQMQLVLRKW